MIIAIHTNVYKGFENFMPTRKTWSEYKQYTNMNYPMECNMKALKSNNIAPHWTCSESLAICEVSSINFSVALIKVLWM